MEGIELARKDYVDSKNIQIEENLNNFSLQLVQKAKRKRNVIDVTDYGAVGDGVTDDRAAIQRAIDDLVEGGTLEIPPPEVAYLIGSFNTAPTTISMGLIINKSIIISGFKNLQYTFKAGVVMDRMVGTTSSGLQGLQMYDVGFDANNLASYGIRMSDAINPYMTLKNVTLTNAKEDNLYISTFAATLEGVISQHSKTGIKIKSDLNEICTSNTLNSCYALSCDVGYDFTNLTYSTLNSCAADFNKLSYRFTGAFGVTMNGCGSEKSEKIFYATGYRGFSINTFYSLENGGESVATPYMFEFASGFDVTLNGIYLKDSRLFTYKLGLTSNLEGVENITILDDSIKRSEVYFVTNYTYSRPIKFLRDDETKNNRTIDVAPTALNTYVDNNLSYKTINHDIVIQLSNGIVSTEKYTILQSIKGSGTITIQGNASDRSLVQLYGGYWLFRLLNVGVTVILKNLTIVNKNPSTQSHVIDIKNSKLILDNVALTTSIVCGHAINAYTNADIKVKANCLAIGTFSGKVWQSDGTAKFTHEARNDTPSSGSWSNGDVIAKSTATATAYSEMICTVSGSPGTWKQRNQIEA